MNRQAIGIAAFAIASLPLAIQAQTLEEVVVTAQKRDQSSQDIPISVSAFSAEQISKLGNTGLQELAKNVAGAEIFDDRGSGQPTWVIRGVGLADFNPNNTPTAAIFYDEAYMFSNVLGGIGLFDIQQVEILKGPQGGLYGRNTSGGAVRVNSRPPEVGEESNGYVRGSYGRWNKSRMEAAVGFDVADNAAIRLAAVTSQGGGWQDSLATEADDEFGDQDFTALRAQLAWQLNDKTEMLLKLDYGRDNSETYLAQGKASLLADASGRCPAVAAGGAADDQCFTLSNVLSNFVFGTGTGPLAIDQDDQGRRTTSNPINELDNDWRSVNMRWQWEGESVSFTSITTAMDYNFKQNYDFDASHLTLFHERSRSELSAWSQEFRWQGEISEDMYWLLGASYSNEEVVAFRNLDLSQLVDFPGLGYRSFTQETKSAAAYAQLEWQFADTLKLHGSLRYTKEDKDLLNYRFFETEGNGVDLNGDGQLQPFFWLDGVNQEANLDSHFSGHLGLDWTPSDEVLIYAKATRGFKSGGFFGGFAFSAAELGAYDEELIWSYELGWKTDLLDRRLRFNGALYYYDYQDVQGFTQEFSTLIDGVLTKLGNLGDAEHKGVEVEFTYLPESIEGLQLSLQANYLNAKISKSATIGLDPDGVQFPIQGLRRTFAPEYSVGIQLDHQADINEHYQLNSSVNYSWRDDINADDAYGTDLDRALFGIESYQLLGMRFEIVPTAADWKVALLLDNVTNEAYTLSSTSDDLGSFNRVQGRPRSWTLEFSYEW
ncbi:TonB-dependent receptor [Pseudoteredinibacter isoporae]|uniref:Iron complex outermembrane receptor protein n=1 Tax=Pseudoteredinibacter isoporae TaxID=570281 RepID=A0A7X0MYN2_9GAMM|nr:TonB-dependent receptor [Pseudoteredinibacter isoporae]MBB6522227.1 iron complex outermembrane receptor protein [Pseudoteredinibacter isoporae]NHO87761.1 TonB-dependent receptor [Pseudoteredinibacter isoporae]NIB23908.1 TonB-dependent receptor [Pseudoteredinibacter isoporae]